ncbi:MAG: GNAT family N-acetyltransferase, partial [Deltaproteobacteria bacterium]
MKPNKDSSWEDRVVPPEEVLSRLEPGMSIFISTGVAEPRTMVKHLMSSDAANIADIELIQVVSLGDAISLKAL